MAALRGDWSLADMASRVDVMAAEWWWAGGTNGHRHAFDWKTTCHLEDAYCRWQARTGQDEQREHETLELQIGVHDYTVDLAAMVQTNIASGRRRSISREVSSVQWRWAGKPGNLYDFDASSNCKLEAAYQTWQSWDGFSHSSLQLNVGEHTYRIHFPSMTQENLASGRQRQVFRDLIKTTDHTNGLSGCLICGCSRQWDDWGERVCWCDSCWFNECTHSAIEHVHSLHDRTELQSDLAVPSSGIQIKPPTRKTTETSRKAIPLKAWHKSSSSLADESSEGCRQYTLKVSFGDDRRRLPIAWSRHASSQEVCASMHAAVGTGFGSLLPESAGLSLRYKDNDGDLCTLCAETLQDCLSFEREGVIRIVAEQEEPMTNTHILIATPREVSNMDKQGNRIDEEICEEFCFDWDIVASHESAKRERAAMLTGSKE